MILSLRRSDTEPVLRFRNHQPTSDALQGLNVERPTVPTVEEQVGTAEAVHNDATQEPLLNLAPKRPNWDLKRDLEPQMKKLRSMTDRAIVRLIRERVSAEEQQSSNDAGGSEPPGERIDLASAIDRQQQLDARGAADDE